MKILHRLLLSLCFIVPLLALSQSLTTAPTAQSLTTATTATTAPLSPATDWLTSEGWQLDAEFEPLGASIKRCRYELEPDRYYRLGFVKRINGVARRAFTEPIKASDIATPINGRIELTLNLPVEQRELEYWIFAE